MKITNLNLFLRLYRRLGLEPGATSLQEEKVLHTTVQPTISMDCRGDVLGQGAVNVAATSTPVLGVEEQASYRLLVNDSDTSIYLGLGVIAVVNSGIRLNANGGWIEFNALNRYSGTINAIHGGVGNKVLTYVEIA